MSKVFIGMAAYNGERFLSEAIESLLNQSFPDFTLFISDDVSTDGTRDICEAYAKKDPRVIYYRQEKNLGMFGNFKFVLDRADKDYFMWAAQDDLWDKDFIKTCYDNLLKYPDRGVSFTNHNVIWPNGSVAIDCQTFPSLSGPKSLSTVIRFVLQPEVLGKPNIFYSLYRINSIRKTFAYYPHQKKWGSDILLSLAAVSHFGIIIDNRVMFSKRLNLSYKPEDISIKPGDKIIIRNPKNKIFPIGNGKFTEYLKGHMQALRDTPYRPVVFVLLLLRSMRAVILHLKTRNYKKFFKL